MAKSPRQKLKLLYLMDLLMSKSDEEHPISIKEMETYLASLDISAERKSLYDDIAALRLFGLDILRRENGPVKGYYVASRDFELPELKLLVDSVQSSKFITHKKTATLIKKIETLASVHEAQLLQRQVYVANRVKTMNESIYYNVDEIHNGISLDRQIRFRYFEYTVTKERRYRRDGGFYAVSPYALTWDNENYYLVAFDSEAGIIKHYRVDKMTDISALDTPRVGKDAYAALDMAMYARKVFGMFSGEEETVRMRFENHLVGAVLDRLGQDSMIIPDGPEHFNVTARVVVSPRFYAWILGFGAAARILGPDDVVQGIREHIAQVAKQYRED